VKKETAIGLFTSGQAPLLIALERLSQPFYKASFLAAAARCGLLQHLKDGPKSLNQIAETLEIPPQATEAIEIWIDIGARLGCIKKGPNGYSLKGWWSRQLAKPQFDTVAASLEEIVDFHHEVLLNAPEMLREGRRLSLADQDGTLIARSTRILEPFVHEAIDASIPAQGKLRLLEVGCGQAAHVRYAAERNQDLHAVAIDLQPEVADQASENIKSWGLSNRVRVMAGDIQSVDVGEQFDILTLHNLIYYFHFDKRIQLLERLRSLLKPGGKLVLTTGCKGGNIGLDLISLWFACSDIGDRLPSQSEMITQMTAAGFIDAQPTNLMPGGSYSLFAGINGAN
jgi:4-hydroxy-2,2'-bipyrrole-5-carbaldehyde O-methyltransferase